MDHFVHGLFGHERDAARAVQALLDAHFDSEAISALMIVAHEVDRSSPAYTAPIGRGAVLGGTLGAIGASVLVLGGVVVAGPVLAAFAGGAAGMLAGGYGGLGQWRETIDFSGHEDGTIILVGVSTDPAHVDRARGALAVAGPRRVRDSGLDEAIRYVAGTDRPSDRF